VTTRRSSRAAAPQDSPATPTSPPARHRDAPAGESALTRRMTLPVSQEEADERYVVARDAWTAAMRRASSGRPADLATLALTQEAYEQAAAELELWRIGARVAIPVETVSRTGLEAAVGQELAWRRIHQMRAKVPGLFARLARRLTGRR